MITINIHIIHGSCPKWPNSKKSKRLAGLLGGHAVIEFNKEVYEFTYENYEFRLFPNRKSSIGVFRKRSFRNWLDECNGEKYTSFHGIVSEEVEECLRKKLRDLLNSCNIDYALFGDRCCSVVHKILADSKVINSSFTWNICTHIPILYRLYTEYALKRINWSITKSHGDKSRFWI